MGKILGVGLATFAAAAVAVPAFSAEYSDFNEEVAKEKEAAATAELFLGQIDEIRLDIHRSINALDTEYVEELGKVPSGCKLQVIEQEPTSIDDINMSSDCDYDEKQVKIARNILKQINDEKDDLIDYLLGSSSTSIISDIESAESVISDAKQSTFIDIYDGTFHETVSVEIDENGELERTFYGDGNEVTVVAIMGYGLLTAMAGLAAFGIGHSIGNTDRRNQSHLGPSEPDALG